MTTSTWPEPGPKNAMIMPNHGVLISAPGVASACDDLYYVEPAGPMAA